MVGEQANVPRARTNRPTEPKDTYRAPVFVLAMSPILLQEGLFGIVSLLFGLLMLLVHLALILWIYSDAQQRSDQPAFLWAIVAFLAPLLGLVLYFIIGRK